MKNRKFVIPVLVVLTAVAITAVAAIFIYPRLALAGGGDHWLRDLVGSGISTYESRLAVALNISVADLQTAQEEARTATIQQAVERGDLTQAEADRLLLESSFGFWNRKPWPGRFPEQGSNRSQALAAALSISEADLTAADQQAETAGVQEALTAGLITQAQADQVLAHIRLKSYINREEFLATALGLSVADLRAALTKGETIPTLLKQQNIDAATLRQTMLAAYQQAIKQAVADEVITQAQADDVLSRGFDPFERGMLGDNPHDHRGDKNRGHGEPDRREPK